VIQFAKDEMTIDFLRRIKAGAVGSRCRVKSDLNPVKTTSITLGFAVSIGREIGAYNYVATTEELRKLVGDTGIAARIVFANKALRNTLIFIDNLPLCLLALVSIQNTLSRDFFNGLPRPFEVG
jgi:hypothetical protein